MGQSYGLIVTRTENLGDEIQSLAARRFLPRVDYWIDRDDMSDPALNEGPDIRVVLNGWWCHGPENWPPAAAIAPLITSFHLSPFNAPRLGIKPSEIFLAEPAINYLKASGPIGARDRGTLRLLERSGVDSYFSGCLTLTLPRPIRERDPDLIVLNDVPDAVAEWATTTTRKRVLRSSHAGLGGVSLPERLNHAQQALDLYATAHCVITTRLHCALPCVAFETPVLLLDTADDRGRFDGLDAFIHHMPLAELTASPSRYVIDRPPANPGGHEPLRDALIENVSRFVAQDHAVHRYRFTASELDAIRRIARERSAVYIADLRKQADTLRRRLELAPAQTAPLAGSRA